MEVTMSTVPTDTGDDPVVAFPDEPEVDQDTTPLPDPDPDDDDDDDVVPV